MRPKISAHCRAVLLSNALILIAPSWERKSNLKYTQQSNCDSIFSFYLLVDPEALPSTWVRGWVDKKVTNLWGSVMRFLFRKQFGPWVGCWCSLHLAFLSNPSTCKHTQMLMLAEWMVARKTGKKIFANLTNLIGCVILAVERQSESREVASLLDRKLSGTRVHCGCRLWRVRCRERGVCECEQTTKCAPNATTPALQTWQYGDLLGGLELCRCKVLTLTHNLLQNKMFNKPFSALRSKGLGVDLFWCLIDNYLAKESSIDVMRNAST